MRRFVPFLIALFVVLAAGVGLDGCNQQSVTVPERSLEASGAITFVCRGHTSTGIDQGMQLSECPDYADPPTRTMVAVVTQTTTNELALIDLVYQKLIDVDPGVPGYTFLRLPSRPGAITTTPGGVASFVGLTSPGKTGISAIPTPCLGVPRPGQHERDVTTFPACTLPSAPGDIAVVIEPPATDGTIAATCADPETPQNSDPPAAALTRDCPANLTTEGGPVGRRKLVVALPDAGQLAIIDAQALLDRQPGSFDPCTVEKLIALDSSPDSTGQSQVPPPDLTPDATCNIMRPLPQPVPANANSRPSSIGVSGNRMYVGDLGVPEVHVLDATSVCGLSELKQALLPMSYALPSRVVTTSRVAVSPLTPSGHQYVYAVDATDNPTSVMAFDVSPGVTDRTPIVRAGSSRQPDEVPDRIAFPAPVQDIDFAYRDLPREDPLTGVASVGVECDPNPDAPIDPASPGVQYRTTGDYTEGARPRLLRGLFGLALLTSGQVEIIDIDDFDAPCRRTYETNSSATEDFRGCKNDTIPYPYLSYTSDGSKPTGDPDGTRSVSDEVSCNMVEPHRTRSANFGLSLPELGIGAPSLRALPGFEAPDSVTNLAPHDAPKLLAVPFANPSGPVPPVAYVGTTLYEQDTPGSSLRVNPNDGQDDDTAVALPLAEPRSYAPNEHDDLVYEGRVMADKVSGFLSPDDGLVDTHPPGQGQALDDTTAFFCDNGVYDVDAMKDFAQSEFGITDDAAASEFANTHADYVQITGDFPSIIDPYWKNAPVQRGYCITKFGQPPRAGATELQPSRDLVIVSAFQGQLHVAPRVPLDFSDDDCDTGSGRYCPPTREDFAACFPQGIRYTVRGSRQWVLATSRPDVTHDVTADASDNYRCIRDCDPRKQYYRGRAFEIGSTLACGDGTSGTNPNCAVGQATSTDGPCSYDPIAKDGSTSGVSLDEPASACIFENLTSRFAIYRGLQPSVRDMTFSWDTTGGFNPLTASLTAISSDVLPQVVRYVPEYQAIAVVDAASLGVSLMSLDTLEVVAPWPVY